MQRVRGSRASSARISDSIGVMPLPAAMKARGAAAASRRGGGGVKAALRRHHLQRLAGGEVLGGPAENAPPGGRRMPTRISPSSGVLQIE